MSEVGEQASLTYPLMDHVEDIFAQLHEPKLDILDISAAYVMKQQHPGKTTSLDTVSIASSSSSSVGSVPLSDAEQRARNRLIVKRCYYKKIVRTSFFLGARITYQPPQSVCVQVH